MSRAGVRSPTGNEQKTISRPSSAERKRRACGAFGAAGLRGGATRESAGAGCEPGNRPKKFSSAHKIGFARPSSLSLQRQKSAADRAEK